MQRDITMTDLAGREMQRDVAMTNVISLAGLEQVDGGSQFPSRPPSLPGCFSPSPYRFIPSPYRLPWNLPWVCGRKKG